MKIRITGKGLPKAQWQNSIVNGSLATWFRTPQNVISVSNNMSNGEEEQMLKDDSPGYQIGQLANTGIAPTSKDKLVSNKVNIGPNAFQKGMGAMRGINQSLNHMMNIAGPLVGFIDQQKRNREIERQYQDSLFGLGPIDYSRNRGDYEFNTGMVDPYNTGAKSKGQFTNPFYLPMAQFGLNGPIPFDRPVHRMIVPVGNMDVPESNFSGASNYDTPYFGIPIPDAGSYVPSPSAPASANSKKSPDTKRSKSSGVNPLVEQTWEEISSQFNGVKNLGVWGDKSHQKRKSDHNTGDALDIGIEDTTQGEQVAQKLIEQAKEKNIKYIIWNKRIWNPSVSNDWRPYDGTNPHSGHVHVSFHRDASSEDLGEVSATHNNPLNIHYSDFSKKYGATQGTDDNGGNVGIFPDLETGIKAAKDLLFGPAYSDLSISQARNKWVNGNPKAFTPSSSQIVGAMGSDKKLKDLSPEERDRLIKQFAKWEGKQGYNLIKEKKLFQAGGFTTENQEDMKIRITQQPLDNMAYGGQLGYGFDLGGRRVYTDMPESKEDSVSNTIGPVPREQANIEAEAGETMLGDIDGDGMLEHMKISGKRHSQGGTPLYAPDGSFIFSDTRKMRIKDPEILKMFGKGGNKSFTPAQIAKNYDMNKYKAILEDKNADPIAKKTAEMMLDNYQKKLGMLALVQEGMKGFPQGIPSVAESVMPQAKFGGYLPKYQAIGEVKKPKPSLEEAKKIAQIKKLEGTIPEGYEVVGKEGNKTYYGKITETRTPGEKKSVTRLGTGPGTTGPGNKVKITGYAPMTVEDILGNANKYRTFHQRLQGAPDDVKRKAAEALLKKGIMPGQYVPQSTRTTTIEQSPDEVTYTPEYIYTETPTGDKTTENTTEKPVGNIPVPNINTTRSNIPYGWTQQDRNNFMNALINRANIRKYPSVRRDFNPVMPDFRNMDWRGKAAELQGMYNSQMSTMGTYGPAQGFAANASFMAGQQAENLVNRAIEPTEQQNVQIYNQVAAQNAGIMNEALVNSANNTFLRSQDRAVLNQNYDNAVRDANKAVVQTLNQGITNASGIYNTNLVESPYYYYDPRFLTMQFNDENARAAFEEMRRNPGRASEGNPTDQLRSIYEGLNFITDEKERAQTASNIFQNLYNRKFSNTTYPMNPAMNKSTTMGQGYLPYPFQMGAQ